MSGEQEARAQAVMEVAEFRSAAAERRALAWQMLIPARFHDANLGEVAQPLRTDLVQWVMDRSTANLILIGPPGTGKTYAAIAACRERHRFGETVIFRSVVRLLEDLRPDGDHQVNVAGLVDCQVLVLDDLAAEKPSEWTREKLDLIVNERWAATLPTVVTANFKLPELRARLGARVWDRLMDGALVYEVTGESRRGHG